MSPLKGGGLIPGRGLRHRNVIGKKYICPGRYIQGDSAGRSGIIYRRMFAAENNPKALSSQMIRIIITATFSIVFSTGGCIGT